MDWLDGDGVERMIEAGRAIVREAVDTYTPDVILAAFSGGNDSVVSTHFAATEFGAHVVHCDTSVGVQRTRQHVDEVCHRYGWGHTAERAEPEGKPGRYTGDWTDGDTAYEEFVLNHGFPGPRQHGRMYQRLKERPLTAVARRMRSGRARKVLVISGIRHDESAIRAGYRREIQAQPGTFLVWANPFYWQTAADFESYRQEFGLPRNPVKATIGISGECLCGAYAAEGEKEMIRRVEPETAAYLDQLEERVRRNGFPWGWGEMPPKWWGDKRRGQGFLPGLDPAPEFSPMCVGCPRKAAKRSDAA
jgi:3'-phosphoadenosine 5'-phosphosulfate sulfotransferase (PAPS reductase)/FAD synthetase